MAIARPAMRGFLSTPSGALPAFPGTPSMLFDGTADSPVSLYSANAFSTYDNAGGGTTVIAHSLGVATFNGESVEISGCTSDAAFLNGTHTLTASGSNTFSIATPLGLPTTVGPVATGVGVFNPVLRWVSQINDQSGNDNHFTVSARNTIVRWDSAERALFGGPLALFFDGTVSISSPWNGGPGLCAMVLERTSGNAVFATNSGTAFRILRDTNFAMILGGSTLFTASTGKALNICRWNDVDERELYVDDVSTPANSDANGVMTSGPNRFFGGGGVTTFGGRMWGFVCYNDYLDGAGELDALKAAIDARWPYPGM